MLYLGIDSGTQSTKCIVLEASSGKLLATAQAPHTMIAGLPAGHLEQHPAEWAEAMESTIAACLDQISERRREIRGIGVSGQQHGLVALDRDGEVLRPAKLWCDTSTVAQCDAFAAAFGGQKEIIRLAGNAILPGFTAPKILWLKENEPANYQRAATFLLPHDYLNFWLTGELTMEYGDASGTGLLDVRTREWQGDLLDFISTDLRGKLPTPQSSRTAAGLLRNTLREKWGLPDNVVVSSGGGDNMMGAIGTGNIQAGEVTASLGTSGTLYAFAGSPVVDGDAGEVAAFCDSTDHWLPLICTMNVTVATEQVRKLFQWDHATLNAAVASVAPGAEGLLFLPYLNGERTPNLPGGCGVFHGLNTQNMVPAAMARAVMEGVTLGLGYGLQKFRALGLQPSAIRLTGGGSNSAVWRQMAADIFNVPVVCLTSTEGAALGAAIQAAWVEGQANGHGLSLDHICKTAVTVDETTRCLPDAVNRAMYAGLQERHLELTHTLHSRGFL